MEDFISSEVSSEEQPTGERWDPLGAPNDQDEETCSLKLGELDNCDHNHW